jgi:putative nucleotidyltransferase with HDIG domain
LNSPQTLKLKFVVTIGTVVTVFVALIFFWMFEQAKRGVIAQVDQQSRALLQQLLITRAWISDHGGVFIVKRPGVEANPFLPGTETTDTKGRTLLYRNPALFTREISQYADKVGLYRFRLTSLKLINPANEPGNFEKEALRYFQEHRYDEVKEGLAGEYIENGIRGYRRIIPLRIENSCLPCHEYQEYAPGDIRGGLSVYIPMREADKVIKRNRNVLIISWLGIICVVLGIIYFFLNSMVLKPVDQLHHVAQRLIEGEYSVRANLSTHDEFEAFAHAFNKMTDRLQKGYEGTIKSLVAAIEARDTYTKGHTARVACYAKEIAREMGLSAEMQAEISLGATLHDIGKIGIADELLGKSAPLTCEEVKIMAAHPEKGAAIIKEADFLLCALPAILYHHERPDGTGYPEGLQGENLPLVARIIAVADTFDAMTTDRPYRKALSVEEALREIEKCSGRQFDSDVVKAFRKAFEHDAFPRER